MRKLRIARAAGLATLLAAFPAGAAERKTVPRQRSVAVQAVTHGEGITNHQADAFEQCVVDALQQTGHFRVVGRSDIEAALKLGEQRQTAGCRSESCAPELAEALGTELVTSTKMTKLGETMVLSLSLVEARSISVLGRAQETVRTDDALPSAATALAGKLVRALWPNASDETAFGGPVITPVGKPEVGDDGTHVVFRLADPNGVAEPQILWRPAGELAFRSEPMVRGSETNLYEARVPQRAVTDPIEYRIVARDAESGESSSWPSATTSAVVQPLKARVAPLGGGKTGHASFGGDRLVLNVTVIARRKGHQEPVVLKGGEALSEEDQVWFGFRANRRAYVYIAERHQSGDLEILFPNPRIGTTNPLEANDPVRVPEGKQVFHVDSRDLGRETILILASPNPLPDVDAAFDRARNGSPGSHAGDVLLAEAVEQPDCRTKGLQLHIDCRPKTRGLVLEGSERDAVIAQSVTIASQASESIVFVPFEFLHVSRTE